MPTEHGILTGPEILKEIKAKRITITPFDKKYVNQGSFDLTLGTEVAVYDDWVETFDITGRDSPTEDGRHFMPKPNRVLDVKQEPVVKTFRMNSTRGWILKPGIGYLMHTAERITTNHFVPVIDGKSSVGRLFIKVHETAGYGETGFDGQYTLEVTAMHPVRIYPGMRFCQIRFHTTRGETRDYKKNGHYTGKAALGAVPSRAWQQFRE